MSRALLIVIVLTGCKSSDEPAQPVAQYRAPPPPAAEAPADATRKLPVMCEKYLEAAQHLGECTGIPVASRQLLSDSAERLRRVWTSDTSFMETGNAQSFNDACRISYEAMVEQAKGCAALVDEEHKTVPNAEHSAPSLPPDCQRLLSLNATLAACRNIPDKDRAALAETIRSLPATLDGVDPEVATAVDHACSLSLETLTQLARDCPALVDDLHKTVPDVEQKLRSRR